MKFSSAGILEQSMHSHPFFYKLNSVIYKQFKKNIKYAFKIVILLHVLILKVKKNYSHIVNHLTLMSQEKKDVSQTNRKWCMVSIKV